MADKVSHAVYSSISKRLILYIALCSSLLTLLLSAFQIYRDYQLDINQIEIDFEQIESVHLSTISETVWVADIERLETIVDGLYNIRDLNYIAVIEDDKPLVSDGIKPSISEGFRSFPLVSKHQGTFIEIGVLEVGFDIHTIRQRLLNRTFIILTGNFFTTILVVLFMVLIFYRLITRHLTFISHYLVELKIGGNNPPLILNRPSSSKAKLDELDLVANSINQYLSEIDLHLGERKTIEESLSYQASHDALTGMMNRYEFERRANNLISTTQNSGGEHALCFMDLDQFKVVNDTCGHIAGDELLRQIGHVLQKGVRHRDTVARLGGDEFGVLMEHCPIDQAQRVAAELQQSIQDFQFTWEGQSFRIGVSMGLVSITDATPNLVELMRQVDSACYMAKDLGRNRIQVYNHDDSEIIQRHGEMQWVARINQALDEDRFCLYAQPIVSLDSNNHGHYEILVRLLDEEGAIIPPGAFLPAAERYNLIEKLDTWVVSHSCAFLSKNPTFTDQIDFVAINLSGQSLTNEIFLQSIFLIFKETGVSPEKVCFEITETAAVTNMNSAIKFINSLKKIGCQFALDDFGSGISSFGYLKHLPVDYLKIDGMFVKDMVEDPIDFAMVKSINEIGQLMGMKTIAEFVENDEIKIKLKTIGVDYGQGYGLGRPEPLEGLVI